MPNEKISAMTSATAPFNDADLFSMVQGGANVHGTWAQIKSQLSVSNALLRNLLAYFKMDDAGPGAADASGNGNNAVETTNPPTYSQPGIINSGITFANNSDNLNTPIFSTAGEMFSLNVWINSAWTGSTGAAIGASDPSNSGFSLYWVGDGTIGFTINGSGSIASTGNIADGLWHMVTLTVNAAGDAKIYIDGALNIANNIGAMTPSTLTPIGLGGGGIYGGFVGTLDEIGIWNTLLNQSQITTLFNSGAALPFANFTN